MTQPFSHAMVSPCNRSVLFPLSLSPVTILRVVVLACPSAGVSTSCTSPASWAASVLMSVAGRRKSLHPCVDLKASTALNASTARSGMPMTCPLMSSLNTLLLSRSCRPGTWSALLLLRTMRFRCALRSPTAGGRAVDCPAPFLPFLMTSVLVPLFGAATMPFFLGLGFAQRAAEVEKHAVCGTAKTQRGPIAEQTERSSESLQRRPS